MKNDKLQQKILDRKLKLEKRQASIDMEKKRVEKEKQELIALEKKAIDRAYKELDVELVKNGIDIKSIDKEQLVLLILENRSVLVEEN